MSLDSRLIRPRGDSVISSVYICDRAEGVRM